MCIKDETLSLIDELINRLDSWGELPNLIGWHKKDRIKISSKLDALVKENEALWTALISKCCNTKQKELFLDTWNRARELNPKLRRPAIGSSEFGFQASWSFFDIPGKVFTLDIYENGEAEWFFSHGTGQPQSGCTENKDGNFLPFADYVIRLMASNF